MRLKESFSVWFKPWSKRRWLFIYLGLNWLKTRLIWSLPKCLENWILAFLRRKSRVEVNLRSSYTRIGNITLIAWNSDLFKIFTCDQSNFDSIFFSLQERLFQLLKTWFLFLWVGTANLELLLLLVVLRGRLSDLEVLFDFFLFRKTELFIKSFVVRLERLSIHTVFFV